MSQSINGGLEEDATSDKEQKVQAPVVVMSGMRVTGFLHIGHYFGALKSWLELQKQHSCFFGLMDWHGLTTAYKKPKELDLWQRDMLADWLAWGLDPQRCVLFVQSRVPEHIELFMILANLTPMGWLERVPTWKDAIDEMKETDTHNLGRFLYPVLQAADIAVYRGNRVPVGADQVAHLELTREIIRRCNHLYGLKLPEPQPILTPSPLVLGLDGRKMSKSYNNGLLLTEEEGALKKKIQSMVTDSKRARRQDPGEPNDCPVYSFHKLYSTPEDLQWVENGCRSAGIGCGDCKAKLLSNINEKTQGPRLLKKEWLNNPKRLDSIIEEGCERARQEARRTLRLVREKMKFHSGGEG